MQPNSIQITHAQRRLGARTALQPLRRECSERSMTGVIGANGAGRGTCGVRLRPRVGWRAMEWDRARVTSTTTPPSVAPTRTSLSTCSWSASRPVTLARLSDATERGR